MAQKDFKTAGTKNQKKPGSAASSLGVDLISDLHLDRWEGQSPDYAADKANDIAIVAGDVDRNPEASVAELKKIAAVYGTVLFVDGNNEFRDALITDANPNYQETEDRLRKAIAAVNATFPAPRIFYLKDQPFIKNGVAVIGRNGHVDYKAALDPQNEKPISVEDALKEQVDVLAALHAKEAPAGTPLPSHERWVEVAAAEPKQAKQDFEDLRDEVIRLNKDPAIHTIVVVTHTLPYIPGSDLLNFPPGVSARTQGSMANADLATLKSYDSGGKIKYWFFAHQHSKKDMTIDGIRYIENARPSPGGLERTKAEVFTKEEQDKYKALPVSISSDPQTPAPRAQAAKKPARPAC